MVLILDGQSAWLYPSVFPSILTDFERGLSFCSVKTAIVDIQTAYTPKVKKKTRTKKSKSRFSLIVRVNIVLNRTVVDSDWRFDRERQREND